MHLLLHCCTALTALLQSLAAHRSPLPLCSKTHVARDHLEHLSTDFSLQTHAHARGNVAQKVQIDRKVPLSSSPFQDTSPPAAAHARPILRRRPRLDRGGLDPCAPGSSSSSVLCVITSSSSSARAHCSEQRILSLSGLLSREVCTLARFGRDVAVGWGSGGRVAERRAASGATACATRCAVCVRRAAAHEQRDAREQRCDMRCV